MVSKDSEKLTFYNQAKSKDIGVLLMIKINIPKLIVMERKLMQVNTSKMLSELKILRDLLIDSMISKKINMVHTPENH